MFTYLGISGTGSEDAAEQEPSVDTVLEDDSYGEAVEILSRGIGVDRVVKGRPIATPVTMMLDGTFTTAGPTALRIIAHDTLLV